MQQRALPKREYPQIDHRSIKSSFVRLFLVTLLFGNSPSSTVSINLVSRPKEIVCMTYKTRFTSIIVPSLLFASTVNGTEVASMLTRESRRESRTESPAVDCRRGTSNVWAALSRKRAIKEWVAELAIETRRLERFYSNFSWIQMPHIFFKKNPSYIFSPHL